MGWLWLLQPFSYTRIGFYCQNLQRCFWIQVTENPSVSINEEEFFLSFENRPQSMWAQASWHGGSAMWPSTGSPSLLCPPYCPPSMWQVCPLSGKMQLGLQNAERPGRTSREALALVMLYEPWSFSGISTRILPSARRGTGLSLKHWVTGLSLNSWLAGGCSHCHWLRSIGSPTPAPRAHTSVGWMVLEHMGPLGRQGSAVGLTGCGGPEGKPECLLQATLAFSLNSTENTYGKSPLWYKFEYMSVFRGNFLKI